MTTSSCASSTSTSSVAASRCSLKQANDSADGVSGEEFDPYLYGMAPAFNEAGDYIGPDGFDPETGEWKAGSEEQRTEWERQYAEAHSRWEAHRKQVVEAREADQAAALESGDALSSYSSESNDAEGTLASDEALQALRDKLHGRLALSTDRKGRPPAPPLPVCPPATRQHPRRAASRGGRKGLIDPHDWPFDQEGARSRVVG